LMMRHFGHGAAIEIQAFGGVTHLISNGQRQTPGQRLLTSLAGPFLELALGLLMLFASFAVPAETLLGFALRYGAIFNLFWALVNLLPILPWDGGNALDAGIELVTGVAKPRAVGVIAMATAVVVAVLAAYAQQYFLALFALIGLAQGFTRFQRGQAQQRVDQLQQMLARGEHSALESRGQQLLESNADPSIRAQLLELLVWSRIHQKDFDGAETLLRKSREYALSPELYARVAASRGNAQAVIEVLSRAAARHQLTHAAAPLLVSALISEDKPSAVVEVLGAFDVKSVEVQALWNASYEKLVAAGHVLEAYQLKAKQFERLQRGTDAFDAALCLTKLEKQDEAMAWLQRAFDLGVRSKERFQNAQLEALALRADFQALLSRATAPLQGTEPAESRGAT
jgi:hypothetical protein